jgi:hypothetical protein
MISKGGFWGGSLAVIRGPEHRSQKSFRSEGNQTGLGPYHPKKTLLQLVTGPLFQERLQPSIEHGNYQIRAIQPQFG